VKKHHQQLTSLLRNSNHSTPPTRLTLRVTLGGLGLIHIYKVHKQDGDGDDGDDGDGLV
jgi:hypothetical protein